MHWWIILYIRGIKSVQGDSFTTMDVVQCSERTASVLWRVGGNGGGGGVESFSAAWITSVRLGDSFSTVEDSFGIAEDSSSKVGDSFNTVEVVLFLRCTEQPPQY